MTGDAPGAAVAASSSKSGVIEEDLSCVWGGEWITGEWAALSMRSYTCAACTRVRHRIGGLLRAELTSAGMRGREVRVRLKPWWSAA
ncbi:hypothetical protein TUSST3_16520 [Streptomyces sp. TUS-ST3]|nr:hypothetical protein TUSST3_16520 [Streptomyces sp. TUS-ST3]